LGGVAFGKGLLSNLTYALEENNFKENWTFFSSEYGNELCRLEASEDIIASL